MGEIMAEAPYKVILTPAAEFQDLVNHMGKTISARSSVANFSKRLQWWLIL
jgi:hypothetical protein